MGNKEELYRRLNQAKRHALSATDTVTKQRLEDLATELQRQIAAVEERDADAPPIILGRRH